MEQEDIEMAKKAAKLLFQLLIKFQKKEDISSICIELEKLGFASEYRKMYNSASKYLNYRNYIILALEDFKFWSPKIQLGKYKALNIIIEHNIKKYKGF